MMTGLLLSLFLNMNPAVFAQSEPGLQGFAFGKKEKAQPTPAPVTTLTLKNATYSEAKQVESCLSYRDCQTMALIPPPLETMGLDGKKSLEFKLVVNQTPMSVMTSVVSCGLGHSLNGKVFLADGTALHIPTLNFAAKAGPRPANLDQNFWALSFNSLQSALDVTPDHSIEKAADELFEIFGLKELGYAISAVREPDDLVATTDHTTKVVEVARSYRSKCKLWWTLRHEAEHIAQIKKVRECQALNQIHHFQFHNLREMSAYLGDAAYASPFCSPEDVEYIKRVTDGSIGQYGQRFIE